MMLQTVVSQLLEVNKIRRDNQPINIHSAQPIIINARK